MTKALGHWTRPPQHTKAYLGAGEVDGLRADGCLGAAGRKTGTPPDPLRDADSDMVGESITDATRIAAIPAGNPLNERIFTDVIFTASCVPSSFTEEFTSGLIAFFT